MDSNTIKERAKSWLTRNGTVRSSNEKEAYLNALQDAGVDQATVDWVENEFYS